jgi:hypothetical protein
VPKALQLAQVLLSINFGTALSLVPLCGSQTTFVSFHPDAEARTFVLEDDCNGIDDPDVLVGFAVFYNQVFDFLSLADVHVMFSGEAVVPTAVPGREPVGIALPRIGKLSASQRLDIEIAVGIDIGAEVNLRLRGKTRQPKTCCQQCKPLPHFAPPVVAVLKKCVFDLIDFCTSGIERLLHWHGLIQWEWHGVESLWCAVDSQAPSAA